MMPKPEAGFNLPGIAVTIMFGVDLNKILNGLAFEDKCGITFKSVENATVLSKINRKKRRNPATV